MNQNIKQAVITAVTDDSSAYPQGQCEHNGKIINYTRLSPYGLDSNPPKDFHLLLFSSQAQEGVRFGMASNMNSRKSGLEKGEIAVYNPVTKSFVFFKENGDIEIDSQKDVVINCLGDTKITATGDVNLHGVNITATASAQASVVAPIVDVTATTSASVTAPTVSVTATILATITAATLNVVSAVQMTVTSASVLLGAVAGAKALITDAAMSILNTHTHQDSVGGTTSAPSATIGASEKTTITKAV
jgi:phage gp45-like